MCLVVLTALGLNWLKSQKSPPPPEVDPINQPLSTLTVDERVKKHHSTLKLKKDLQKQKAKAERFKPPVDKVDPIDSSIPEVSALDKGVRFPDNTPIQKVVEDLNEPTFTNDIYSDPENIIHTQMLEDDLQEQKQIAEEDKEEQEFISRFTELAKEQGYKPHFTKDSKVILEPIKKKEEPEIEEIKIKWK